MKTATVFATLILCLFLIGFIVIDTYDENTADITETSNLTETSGTTAAECIYTLKEYNGKLAVFEADSQEPFEIFSILVSTLPEEDRDMLKTGIVTDSREELQRLVEDYTG